MWGQYEPGPYRIRLVRVASGDPNPDGPGRGSFQDSLLACNASEFQGNQRKIAPKSRVPVIVKSRSSKNSHWEIVTAQLPRPSYTNRSRPIRLNGSLIKVSSKLHPCFLAVARADRIVAKSLAPSSDRNPPDTFCVTFIILPSCSARLLVNGTVGSVRKRSTSCLRLRRRSSRLWPSRGGRARWSRRRDPIW